MWLMLTTDSDMYYSNPSTVLKRRPHRNKKTTMNSIFWPAKYEWRYINENTPWKGHSAKTKAQITPKKKFMVIKWKIPMDMHCCTSSLINRLPLLSITRQSCPISYLNYYSISSLFYCGWNNNLQNEHHAAWKKTWTNDWDHKLVRGLLSWLR